MSRFNWNKGVTLSAKDNFNGKMMVKCMLKKTSCGNGKQAGDRNASKPRKGHVRK